MAPTTMTLRKDESGQSVLSTAAAAAAKHGLGGHSHNSKGKQQYNTNLPPPGNFQGQQERHWQHQDQDLGEHVERDVGPRYGRRPAPGARMGPTIPIGNHGHAGGEGGYEGEAAAHDDEADGSVADSVEEDGAEDAKV